MVYSWYTVGTWYKFGIHLVYSWYTVGIQLEHSWYTIGIQWYTMVYQYMTVFINVTNNDLIMSSVNHIDLRRIKCIKGYYVTMNQMFQLFQRLLMPNILTL